MCATNCKLCHCSWTMQTLFSQMRALLLCIIMLLAIKCATCFFAFVIWQLYVWIHWIHWILRGLCSHQLIPSRDFGPKTMWTLNILFHVNVCCHIYEPMFVQRNVWCRMNKVLPRLTNFYNMWKVLTKMCRAETNPNLYTHCERQKKLRGTNTIHNSGNQQRSNTSEQQFSVTHRGRGCEGGEDNSKF